MIAFALGALVGAYIAFRLCRASRRLDADLTRLLGRDIPAHTSRSTR